MTCFWDGLMAALGKRRITATLGAKATRKPTRFVEALKRHNRPACHVLHDNQRPSQQFLAECQRAVRELDVSRIGAGYWCSSSDPFLWLVCELFGVNVVHHYRGHQVTYTYAGPSAAGTSRAPDHGPRDSAKRSHRRGRHRSSEHEPAAQTVYVQSDDGHFWAG